MTCFEVTSLPSWHDSATLPPAAGADGRTAIHVEFLFTNMAYAMEAGFSSQQTHEFLSMTENVLQGSIVALLSEGAPCLSQHDSFALFKREVLSRSTDAAGGPGAFEMSAIAQMTDFVARSFYRYYRAYALTFAHVPPVKTSQRTLQVELPLTFPPLSDATQVPFVPPPDDR
eukprot:TRINITY_DN3172_c0_g1_i2.p3 TRINITY_DN3172_c0_g1~~TRINITY_DN3172_c0_g1_i2.p3  ORF type:complete len:172 (-),score=41.50 TRINITY_DN3172_c0_g1_i2:56-571(-)